MYFQITSNVGLSVTQSALSYKTPLFTKDKLLLIQHAFVIIYVYFVTLGLTLHERVAYFHIIQRHSLFYY